MIPVEKWMIFTTLQKLPKNVGDLGKSKALESCPKSNKSPNLVTLLNAYVLEKNVFKWANPGLFLFYFCLFKQTLQFLQQINVKNVHPVSGTRIQTHNLLITSLFP